MSANIKAKRARVMRCQICGAAFYGPSEGGVCPTCGAHAEFLCSLEAYEPPRAGAISAQEKRFLMSALILEIRNTEFYKGASAAARTEDDARLAVKFHVLAGIEKAHERTIRQILRQDPPDIEALRRLDRQHDACGETNLVQAHRREDIAVKMYRTFARLASNPRVKQVFRAIAEIETDHVHATGTEEATGT